MVKVCPLCKSEKAKIKGIGMRSLLWIDCPICGIYQISQNAAEDIPGARDTKKDLIKISAFTRHRTIINDPVITLMNIQNEEMPFPNLSLSQVIQLYPKNPKEKCDLVLQNLAGLSTYQGSTIILTQEDYAIFYPEINEDQAVYFIMKYLSDCEYISDTFELPAELSIRPKGWERIEEITLGKKD